MKVFQKIGRWFRNLFSDGITTPEQRKNEWDSVHQPFELRFHQKHNYRWDERAFRGQWDEIFGRFLGYTQQHFSAGQTLIDVGCGSRPVLDWFTGAPRKIFLDPLLDQYRQIDKMHEYWSAKRPDTLFSQPAEKMVPTLAGQCDFVNCWNVLDHTYDWRLILNNIRDYAKPGARVCLGTDFASHGEGHPGIEDQDYFFRFVNEHFEIVAERRHYVHREIALHLRRKESGMSPAHGE